MGRESQSKSLAHFDGSLSLSSSSIKSNLLIKRQINLVDSSDSSVPVGGASTMATACLECLFYVLIWKGELAVPTVQLARATSCAR